MALYDDLDTKRTDQIDGWSSGIKLMQSQLALKKTVTPTPRRDFPRKPVVLPPVINLKTKKENDSKDMFKEQIRPKVQTTIAQNLTPPSSFISEYDWDVVDEYDPLWPNEYEKLVKDKRDKERERDKPREDNRKRDDRDKKRKNSRFSEESPPAKFSGFAGRPSSDDEDSYKVSTPVVSASSRASGAAIAPPPSLQESIAQIPESAKSAGSTAPFASSVAAKIMAKYGFRDGQGLGKQEQGMSVALQVEKTSKRGGRIIHEKEMMAPPAFLPPPSPPQPAPTPAPSLPLSVTTDTYKELSITEIMKSPSKVVLLRNMVGPGDVDNELEPEVKDECNSKYGEVISVIIHEFPEAIPEEAVRIFVEFKRIESAIKAVVDLNGRFFGGRQVRAGFYSLEKFHNLQLTE